MTLHVVPDGVPEMPLARYLTRAYHMMPASIARGLINRRDVRREGKRLGAGDMVRGGDELAIFAHARYLSGALDVIYIDEGLLAVCKPPGLPVDVDADGIGADTLIERARAQVEGDVWLCHRLDTWTSGVTLIARDIEVHQAVLAAFARHAVDKRYLCLVVGDPPRDSDTLRAYLVKDARRAQVSVLDYPAPGALAIETRYRVLERRGAITRLEVFPVTGRTHQIRAHMASVGLPVLGDDRYGDRAANRREGAARLRLHCQRLRLPDEAMPERFRGMEFSAEAPF